jgi:hypothetical protein
MMTVAEQSERVRLLEAKEQSATARKDFNAKIDGRIKDVWAWMLANPKPTPISISIAP